MDEKKKNETKMNEALKKAFEAAGAIIKSNPYCEVVITRRDKKIHGDFAITERASYDL